MIARPELWRCIGAFYELKKKMILNYGSSRACGCNHNRVSIHAEQLAINYCKEHNLQNLDDKRIILPDKSLQKLLRIKKSDQLTYFNLQKYMKVHFPNKEGIYPTA